MTEKRIEKKDSEIVMVHSQQKITQTNRTLTNNKHHRICNGEDHVLSSIMTYHRVCNQRYHQWSMNCLPFLSTWVHLRFSWGSCYSILSFLCTILQIVVCPFVLFLFAILLCVFFIDIQDSNYPFGIFKLFLCCRIMIYISSSNINVLIIFVLIA